MHSESGYFYLNLANEWPTFELHGLQIAPDGSLGLTPTSNGAYEPRGVFRAGPFKVAGAPTDWYRLRVLGDPLPDGTHVQVFTFGGGGSDAPYTPGAEHPFDAPGWQAAPRDALDLLIQNPPAQQLWVGGVILGRAATPRLHQMRVDYGRDTSIESLPAIFGRDETQCDFLERFLSLNESVLGGLVETVIDLPRLFDPIATPSGEFPSWLTWLAGWLDFSLSETWGEAEARGYLAQAFHLYGQRGTIEGLRRYLKIYAGVEARIDEPGLQTTLWSLGETSTLGFTTTLAPAHPQGAVVETTSTLDQSHLTRGDSFGAPLFEETAHHFCVQVYCAELTRPGALDDVRDVIEREKPAHTTYELCLIEPRMRVGVQARVGIDAIVAQGPPAAYVGMRLDIGALGVEAEACEEEE